jgi:hypothetical protein
MKKSVTVLRYVKLYLSLFNINNSIGVRKDIDI